MISIAIFFAGFVASIYAWPKIRAFVVGAAAEAASLRAKAAAIEAKVKGWL